MKKSFFLVGVAAFTLILVGINLLIPVFQKSFVVEKLLLPHERLLNDMVESVQGVSDTEVFTPLVVESKDPTLLFLGDIMLDRYVRKKVAEDGVEKIFEGVSNMLLDRNIDLTVANLEGTISEEEPRELTSTNTMFRFDPEIVEKLLDYGVDLVSLANNHSRDFGRESFEETQEYLDTIGLPYFGNYWNEDPMSVSLEVQGRKIALVGYHQLINKNKEKVIEAIRNRKNEGNTVIVFPHWGTEYRWFPSERQKEDAYAFIDAGADMIIGAHPHVIQPFEIYNGKPIAYSLGNFVFDQIAPNTREGLALKMTLSSDEIRWEFLPVSLQSIELLPLEAEAKERLLKRLAKDSEMNEDMRLQIENGFLKIPL